MRISYLVLLLSFMTLYSHAQFTVLTDNLDAPVGVRTDVYRNHWVSETGTGANDGQITIITPDGRMIPVITGLPSFFSPTTRDVRGAWQTFELPKDKVAVVIGEGPGPMFGRILIFNFRGFRIGHSTPKTMADAIKSIDISTFALSLSGVENSNPFSLALDHWGNMYVADAGANKVIKIDKKGKLSDFATIPPFPNPLPFGPPFVDPVPTKIISKGYNSFYLAQLTGFPFAEGAAKIYEIDFKGRVTTHASGLSMLTDMALDKRTGEIYALQFGSFGFVPFPGFQQGSATISRVSRNGGQIEKIAEGFGPASGLGLDDRGNILVTELSGRLLKFTNTVPRSPNNPPVTKVPTFNNKVDFIVYPSPAINELTIEWSSESIRSFRLIDVSGSTLIERMELNTSGRQIVDLQTINSGVYFLQVSSQDGIETKKIVVKK